MIVKTFSDARISENTACAASIVFDEKGRYLCMSVNRFNETDTSEAELLGILQAVTTAIELLGKDDLTINHFTDSMVNVKAFNEGTNKHRSSDTWKKLFSAIEGVTFTMEWVSGHDNLNYNEVSACDKIAKVFQNTEGV